MSELLTESAAEMILVRYGELTLKGGNRPAFESKLIHNVKKALKQVAPVHLERRRDRLAVFPERRFAQVTRRLQDVFGISSLSPAWGTAPEPEAIAEVAARVLGDVLDPLPKPAPEARLSFRVSTQRGDKRFPMTSVELDRFVADRVLPLYGDRLLVRMKDAELNLGIDVRKGRAYVFARRLPGAGGLPVGTLGRGLCLLSGGIDSPVAAWLAMKRGLSVAFLSFHSYPFLGDSSKQKIARLVRALSRYQPRNRLFVAPFTEVQTAIRDRAPEAYRTVLYRRMMQRIASRVALRDRAQVLVTGESLGQVASQTVENLTCIGEASELPVLRPLIAYDKQETIALARRIGTLETSNLPEPDCCTVFMPSRPVIRGRLAECEAAEARLDVAGLVEGALAGMEVVDVREGAE